MAYVGIILNNDLRVSTDGLARPKVLRDQEG